MIETYRMLGHEHEADLAREATRRQQGSLVRRALSGGPSRGLDSRGLRVRFTRAYRRAFLTGMEPPCRLKGPI